MVDKRVPRPPRYQPAVYVCPKCGERIEGDMPVIAHAINGCRPKQP
jgi:hypothetical protein